MSLNECETAMHGAVDALVVWTQTVNEQQTQLLTFFNEHAGKLPDEFRFQLTTAFAELEELSRAMCEQLSPLLTEGLNYKLGLLRAYLHD